MGPLLRVFGTGIGDLVEDRARSRRQRRWKRPAARSATLLPPPAMNGKVTAVRIERDGIVQVFGPGTRQRLSPPATATNYIYWRGGCLTFGKLTMSATDLELIDEDPAIVRLLSRTMERSTRGRLLEGHTRSRAESTRADYNDLRRPPTARESRWDPEVNGDGVQFRS